MCVSACVSARLADCVSFETVQQALTGQTGFEVTHTQTCMHAGTAHTQGKETAEEPLTHAAPPSENRLETSVGFSTKITPRTLSAVFKYKTVINRNRVVPSLQHSL